MHKVILIYQKMQICLTVLICDYLLTSSKTDIISITCRSQEAFTAVTKKNVLSENGT